jgi:hypothetical protein
VPLLPSYLSIDGSPMSRSLSTEIDCRLEDRLPQTQNSVDDRVEARWIARTRITCARDACQHDPTVFPEVCRMSHSTGTSTASLLAMSVKTCWFESWRVCGTNGAAGLKMATQSVSWTPVFAVYSVDCLLSCIWPYSGSGRLWLLMDDLVLLGYLVVHAYAICMQGCFLSRSSIRRVW